MIVTQDDLAKEIALRAVKDDYCVYLLRCRDGSLYCGITHDIAKRLEAHNKGRGSKYTRARLPVTLHALSRMMSKPDALRLEYRIKHARRSEKVKMLLEA